MLGLNRTGAMQNLKVILDLQELDMNMLRLLGVKEKRGEELKGIHKLRKDLEEQRTRKEHDVLEMKKNIKLLEVQVKEHEEKIEKLEKAQNTVKKVDEFNALSQEITSAERAKAGLTNQINELTESLVGEEETLASIKESLETTTESSAALEKEIHEGIALINKEGRELKTKREEVAKGADKEMMAIYERLLNNKRDRVVVPLENRACSGCHIVVTAQHENLVRKGERLVFCEHCSRIHYWPEAVEETTPRRRRRKVS